MKDNNDIIPFYIRNWDKYNAERKNYYTWFKVDNRWYEDEALLKLPTEGRLLFLYCLALAAERHRFLFVTVASHFVGCTPCTLRVQMENLFDSGLLSKTCTPCTKVLELKKEKEIEIKGDVCFDFEYVYSLYPKRPGNNRKLFGMKRLAREIKTQPDFASFLLAIENYATYCQTKEVQPKYVKQFGTFTGEWREWVEIENLEKVDWHG